MAAKSFVSSWAQVVNVLSYRGSAVEINVPNSGSTMFYFTCSPCTVV